MAFTLPCLNRTISFAREIKERVGYAWVIRLVKAF